MVKINVSDANVVFPSAYDNLGIFQSQYVEAVEFSIAVNARSEVPLVMGLDGLEATVISLNGYQIYSKAYSDKIINFQTTQNFPTELEELIDQIEHPEQLACPLEIRKLQGYSSFANCTRPSRNKEPFVTLPIARSFSFANQINRERRLQIWREEVLKDFQTIENAMSHYQIYPPSYRLEVTVQLSAVQNSAFILCEFIQHFQRKFQNYAKVFLLDSLRLIDKECFTDRIGAFSNAFKSYLSYMFHIPRGLTVFEVETICLIERLLIFLVNGNTKYLSEAIIRKLSVKQSIMNYCCPYLPSECIDLSGLTLTTSERIKIFDLTNPLQGRMQSISQNGPLISLLTFIEKHSKYDTEQLDVEAIVDIYRECFHKIVFPQFQRFVLDKLQKKSGDDRHQIALLSSLAECTDFPELVQRISLTPASFPSVSIRNSPIKLTDLLDFILNSALCGFQSVPEYLIYDRAIDHLNRELLTHLSNTDVIQVRNGLEMILEVLPVFPTFSNRRVWSPIGCFSRLVKGSIQQTTSLNFANAASQQSKRRYDVFIDDLEPAEANDLKAHVGKQLDPLNYSTLFKSLRSYLFHKVILVGTKTNGFNNYKDVIEFGSLREVMDKIAVDLDDTSNPNTEIDNIGLTIVYLSFMSFIFSRMKITFGKNQSDVVIMNPNNNVVVKYFLKLATTLNICGMTVLNKQLFNKRTQNNRITMHHIELVTGNKEEEYLTETNKRALMFVKDPRSTVDTYFWSRIK
jgi:hypothetical protein